MNNKKLKDAYELVDDFICMMMNEAQSKANEVLTDLLPDEKLSGLDRQGMLIDAIEEIKEALEKNGK